MEPHPETRILKDLLPQVLATIKFDVVYFIFTVLFMRPLRVEVILSPTLLT